MHIHDVVSTGVGVGRRRGACRGVRPEALDVAAVMASLAANELARAMGMRDLYPFALSPGARRKIEAAGACVRRGSA